MTDPRSPRIPWVDDVSQAGWLAERLHPFGQDTGSVVPEGFERYARLLHPADGERWVDIAARNGRLVHPEMQLHAVAAPAGSAPVPGDLGPGFSPGSLPRPDRERLVAHLRSETTTPEECWFCFWEGYGLDHHGIAARVELPARRYLLAHGRIDDAVLSAFDGPFGQSANLWWPADRAWVVVTEVDYAWTYVGGTAALVERLLDDTGLEALPVELSHKPFYDSDLLNAALDG